MCSINKNLNVFFLEHNKAIETQQKRAKFLKNPNDLHQSNFKLSKDLHQSPPKSQKYLHQKAKIFAKTSLNS